MWFGKLKIKILSKLNKMIAIIQARCKSKRFKNKVLKFFLGKPIIQHVVDNVKKSKKLNKVIVATSKNKSDDKLIKYLKKKKINFYRGSHLNVAKRLSELAEKKKSNFFIRISGDSPFVNAKIIDRAISLHKKRKNVDLITNVFPRTFPMGQSVEIIKTKIIRKNLKRFNVKDKEHVTRYFYENNDNFSIINFRNKSKKKIFKMSIDTKKDFNFLEKKFLVNKILNEN